jgi:hypothetical protein
MAGHQFWNDIQDYHFHKEQLYNRLFHGYGIVPGVNEELKITPIKKSGNLTVIIGTGLAIDGLGRSLFLYETQARIIDYKNFKLPTTVYFIIHYKEVLEDFYQSIESPDYKGYKKKVETAVVEVTTELPDNVVNFEIGRILLDDEETGEIKEINIPADYSNPGKNEIDIRFVSWIKTARPSLSPYLRKTIVDTLETTKETAIIVNETTKLKGMRDMQTIALTGKMLVECGDVEVDDIVHIFYPIYDINSFIVLEMLEYERVEEKRVYSSNASFNDYRNSLFEMGELIKYYDGRLETLDKVIKCNESMIKNLRNLIVSKKITLEDISYMSSPMPRVLIVEDKRYALVDFLDFNDPETKQRSNFELSDMKDYTSTRSDFTYPDGVDIVDTIQRYIHGRVSFDARNLIRRKELLLIRRSDIYNGDYSVKVFIDDTFVQDLIIDGFDTVNRWRNLSVVFREDLVKSSTVRISFELSDTGRDNFGTIWLFQRL